LIEKKKNKNFFIKKKINTVKEKKILHAKKYLRAKKFHMQKISEQKNHHKKYQAQQIK